MTNPPITDCHRKRAARMIGVGLELDDVAQMLAEHERDTAELQRLRRAWAALESHPKWSLDTKVDCSQWIVIDSSVLLDMVVVGAGATPLEAVEAAMRKEEP